MKKAILITGLVAAFFIFAALQAQEEAIVTVQTDIELISQDIDKNTPSWVWDVSKDNPEALGILIQILSIQLELLSSDEIAPYYVPYLREKAKHPELEEMVKFFYLYKKAGRNYELTEKEKKTISLPEFKIFYDAFEKWMDTGLPIYRQKLDEQVTDLVAKLRKFQFT